MLCGSFSAFGLDERPVLLLDVGLSLYPRRGADLGGAQGSGDRSSYADTFFPMVLLHFGHAETFYWAGTVVYVMTTFLVGMILVILFANGSRFTPLTAAMVGVCLLLLPLILRGRGALRRVPVLRAGRLRGRAGPFGGSDRSQGGAGSLLGFASVLAIVAP